jgi:glycosyltransferase involved in cell wall biosynthesis
VHHLGKRRGFDPRMFWRLRRVVRDFRPNILHTHSYVLRYAAVAGAPAIVHTVHNVADREVDAIGRAIHRAAFRRNVATVAISGIIAESFERVYGRKPNAIIPNGIALERYGAATDWRARNGFSPDDLLVVSVARLEPQKNPLGLLDSFAAAGLDSRSRLLIAGDGSLRGGAEARAHELGIADRVAFVGVRADIAEMLSACDLFALASGWEGSPVAIIEAMASGLPVIATAVGGVPELVADGDTGFLVRPGDTAAFAGRLAQLARDPDLRRRMGDAARSRAVALSAGAMIERYSELFQRVAA